MEMLEFLLEALVREGSRERSVHTALGKVIVESNNDPEHFLNSDPFYDPVDLGQYCEARGDPRLASVAYAHGLCDAEMVACTAENQLFKVLAMYVVRRMDAGLWSEVLDEGFRLRRQLIDQVKTHRTRYLTRGFSHGNSLKSAKMKTTNHERNSAV